MTKPSLALVWSPQAEADLIEIWRYGAAGTSPDAADFHLRELYAVCARLADWPNSGPARAEIAPGLRSVLVSPHVVFYRVTSTSVQVVRVLHGRRDLDAIFDEHDK